MEIYFPHLTNGQPNSRRNEGPFTHNRLRLAADRIALVPYCYGDISYNFTRDF